MRVTGCDARRLWHLRLFNDWIYVSDERNANCIVIVMKFWLGF